MEGSYYLTVDIQVSLLKLWNKNVKEASAELRDANCKVY